MRLRSRIGSPAIVLAILLAAVPAPGGAAHVAPTVIESADAAVGAEAIAISASVDFGGTAPVTLAEDDVGDAPPAGAGRPLGLDLLRATAWVADGDEDVVTFAWNLAQLDRAPPPEGVRYYWEFTAGAAQYSLQAKFTDFAASNLPEDPQGFVTHAGAIFRLRGNCGSLTPVITIGNCAHIAWLTGAFDTAAKQVRINVPLNIAAAPGLRPGVGIGPDDTANSIWASLQAALDNASTRDSANQEETWTLPTRTAGATLVDADGAEVRSASLTVGAAGAVSGSLPTAGLPPGEYRLDVQACFGENCATQAVPVRL